MGPFDVALLASAIGLTTPILLTAIGEVISERAGVLNVGLEGMILAGAFGAYFVAWETGSPVVGLLGGMVAGSLFGLIMGVLAVRLGADQIVAGVGINILAVGATTFAFSEIFGGSEQVTIDRLGDVAIPVLSDLGALGDVLFNQDPLTYFAYLSVPLCWYLLFRTNWGLAIRGSGEQPAAVDASGISVARTRWAGILAASMLAGLAGAYLSVVEVGIFRQEMSAGRGFLALTAVIFGRWHPTGVLGACLLFGAADALQLRLQAQGSVPLEVWLLIGLVGLGFLAYMLTRRDRPVPYRAAALAGAVAVAGVALAVADPVISLPYQLWLAMPFILALIVLASTVGRARMPKALTLAYRRGEA